MVTSRLHKQQFMIPIADGYPKESQDVTNDLQLPVTSFVFCLFWFRKIRVLAETINLF